MIKLSCEIWHDPAYVARSKLVFCNAIENDILHENMTKKTNRKRANLNVNGK
jgi:hypothetical protein